MQTGKFSVSLLAVLALSSRAHADDAITQFQGDSIQTPWERSGTLTASECLELRALELGTDVVFTLELGDTKRTSTDAGVGRHGLHELAVCAEKAQRYTITARTEWSDQPANAKVSLETLAQEHPRNALTREYATALAQVGQANARNTAPDALARSAEAWQAAGEHERAAHTWFLAMQAAQIALDQSKADAAFEKARELFGELGWLRYSVIVLNDRSVALVPVEPERSVVLIEAAQKLAPALNDSILSAVIANNVCLAQSEAGALMEALQCFESALELAIESGASQSAIGAARNNVGLAKMNLGQFALARDDLARAMTERLDGGDLEGHLVTLGNLGLCEYHLGDVGAALKRYHQGFRLATERQDERGRALMAGYLAGTYLAWGDANTGYVFSKIEEAILRAAKRGLDLSRALRIRARIELARGNDAAAQNSITEAWELALSRNSLDSLANIAPVKAEVVLRVEGPRPALTLIEHAKALIADRFPGADLLSLDIIAVRAARLDGKYTDARLLRDDVLRRAAYPTGTRARALVEAGMLAYVDSTIDAPTRRTRYADTMASIRDVVRLVPDPELALRASEDTRPLVEAALADVARHCSAQDRCAQQMLDVASLFFQLGRLPPASPSAAEHALDRGVFQALSRMEARGGNMRGRSVLIDEAKRAQARMRLGEVAPDSCVVCAPFEPAERNIIYFLGDKQGWRWQRTPSGWALATMPAWSELEPALRSIDLNKPFPAVLSRLVAQLEEVGGEDLAIGGDSRTVRIPWNGLELAPDVYVIDRYATRVVVDVYAEPVNGGNQVHFIYGAENGPAELPMVTVERKHFERWAEQHRYDIVQDSSAMQGPLRLLHVAAHGQADIGNGISAVWARDQPIVSFVDTRTAAETVVLNACESGASAVAATAQSSIAMGYFQSGANSVIATLTLVPDAVAARFAGDFYRVLSEPGSSYIGAARSAQLAARGSERIAGSWKMFIVFVRLAKNKT